MKSSLPDILFWAFFAVIATIGFFFYDSLLDANEELRVLNNQEAELRKNVTEHEKKYNWQESYKTRMLENDFFFREARERLNYAAPGEIVIQVR